MRFNAFSWFFFASWQRVSVLMICCVMRLRCTVSSASPYCFASRATQTHARLHTAAASVLRFLVRAVPGEDESTCLDLLCALSRERLLNVAHDLFHLVQPGAQRVRLRAAATQRSQLLRS